jgi:hypothetical protein
MQNDCFTAEGVDAERLALFLRYQTTHQRAFHKALAALMAAQKTRRREQRQDEPAPLSEAKTQRDRGFVSQNVFVSQPPLEDTVKIDQFDGDRERTARYPGVARLQSQAVA